MDPWSNIETSTHDTEIDEVNRFEAALGHIPSSVRKIRELITWFEDYRQNAIPLRPGRMRKLYS